MHRTSFNTTLLIEKVGYQIFIWVEFIFYFSNSRYAFFYFYPNLCSLFIVSEGRYNWVMKATWPEWNSLMLTISFHCHLHPKSVHIPQFWKNLEHISDQMCRTQCHPPLIQASEGQSFHCVLFQETVTILQEKRVFHCDLPGRVSVGAVKRSPPTVGCTKGRETPDSM